MGLFKSKGGSAGDAPPYERDAKEDVYVTATPANDGDNGSLNDDDAALQATTGYKSDFKREFKSLSTISFAFSIMGLISSVATTFNLPFLSGGPASTVFAWMLGAIMNLTLGAAIGELVSAYPSAGGLYSASGLVVPRRYRAITAWFTGWLNFTGQIAGIAGTEYGLAQMIFAWAYVLTGYSASVGATYGLYAALLIVHGILNCFPTGWLARFTSSYVFINLGMTVITGVLVLARTPAAEMHTGSYVFGEIRDGTGYGSNAFAFLVGLTCVQFVMTDYDATAHISEEVERAAIAAPVAIFVAVAGTGLFGFFLNVAMVFASGDVASQDLSTFPGELAFAQIVFLRGGRVAFLVIWPFICSVAFFVVQTATQANARSFYAFSRDGGLPKIFSKVIRGSTVPAVILVVVACAALGLLSFASYAAVAAIFSLAALGMDLSYMVPILCAMIFRRHPDVNFKPGPFWMGWGWFGTTIRIIACIWTVFECVVLVIPTVSPLTAQNMNYSWVVMLGVLLLAAAA
ncbi:amino acid transporter [Ceraceosorus guamensis]|uniref:Amino acid transporter n=1 Tax=Ceraceosorus guamensis TaxID=1522189 RepID=A0A316VSP3_9BASI|nr:amino acid transporter [Ceraceosorus guamensis]PWN40058.1 amino acid transporter [Ceraceosorus guamensis]